MNGDSMKRAKEIFVGAVDLSTTEREIYLREQCSDDRALLKEVQALLAYADDDPGLEQPVWPTLTNWSDTSPIGQGIPIRIGGYRILSRLGQGGMGVVYLAEQLKPVKRRVALKVIKLGMDSQAIVARFEAERQALAVMNHPGIAKIFDGGTVPRDEPGAGAPFFVMEYVKGVPLTEHSDKHRLSIDERLELFIQVCEAVQHAHTKGVIHRDLKPSNILVTYEGDKAVPKIIDFGVAKALNQRLSEQTIFTEQGQMIGTPEYMSPEQAEMSGQDIDTRSDVYSLGVILYELLTGVLPFDPQNMRQAGYLEIQRIIREVDPPKPSTRFASLLTAQAEMVSKCASSRRAEPSTLSRRLRTDLDWVAMKCLEKERARRYETARSLAEEIRRFLDHEPVSAGPPTAVYRLRKFTERNRGLVITSVVVGVSLLLASIVSTLFAYAAQSARSDTMRALADRDEALRDAVKERAIALEAQTVAQSKAQQLRAQLYFGQIKLAAEAMRLGDLSKCQEYLYSCPPDLRSWEWGHLRWRARRNVTLPGQSLLPRTDEIALATLDLSTSAVYFELSGGGGYRSTFTDANAVACEWGDTGALALALSTTQDGRYHAILQDNGQVLIVDTTSGKSIEVRHSDSKSRFTSLASCHANPRFVLGDDKGSVFFWTPGSLSATHSLSAPPSSGTSEITCVATDAHDRYCAAATASGQILIWDTTHQNNVLQFLFTDGQVLAFAFSLDSQLLFGATSAGAVASWSLTTGAPRVVFDGHVGPVKTMTIAPGGDRLFTGGDDGTLRVWDVSTGSEILRLQADAGNYRALGVTADAALVSLDARGQLQLWPVISDSSPMPYPEDPQVVLLGARRLSSTESPQDAEPVYAEALNAYKYTFGHTDPRTLQCAVEYASSLIHCGETVSLAQAEQLLTSAWGMLVKTSATYDSAIAERILVELSHLYRHPCRNENKKRELVDELLLHPFRWIALGQSLPKALTEDAADLIESAPGVRGRLDNGDEVLLTVDDHLQRRVFAHLAQAYDKHAPSDAVAIVMDPRRGDILALCCIPERHLISSPAWHVSYSDTLFQVFEPGSLFRVFTAAAALSEGVVVPGESVDIGGPNRHFGRRRIQGQRDHDALTVEQIVAKSSNIGMAVLGVRMGNEALYSRVRAFGFGRRTGVGLAGEDPGIVLPLSRWSTYSTTSIPLGQEINVSPLQLISAFCAILNDGVLMQPRIVRAQFSDSGLVSERYVTPRSIGRVLDRPTARYMREVILPQVVNSGVGRMATVEGHDVCGVTGTAQLPSVDKPGYEQGAYVTAFLGAVPASCPAAAVLVILKRPDGEEYTGGTVAGPVVGAVLRDVVEYLDLPNSKD